MNLAMREAVEEVEEKHLGVETRDMVEEAMAEDLAGAVLVVPTAATKDTEETAGVEAIPGKEEAETPGEIR